MVIDMPHLPSVSTLSTAPVEADVNTSEMTDYTSYCQLPFQVSSVPNILRTDEARNMISGIMQHLKFILKYQRFKQPLSRMSPNMNGLTHSCLGLSVTSGPLTHKKIVEEISTDSLST